MRHALKGRRFNRPSSQRLALMKGLANALIKHEQVTTTLAKAKDLRSVVEKLVTRCKDNTLANRRYILSFLNGNEDSASKLLNILGPRYKERPGGYVRVLKAGFRYGDSAPRAVIEFVERDITAKGKDSGPTQDMKSRDSEEELA